MVSRNLNGIQFSAHPQEGFLVQASIGAYDPSVEGEDKMVGGMWLQPNDGSIDHIYVHPSHQRRGIATQMFELAKIAHQTMPDKYPNPKHSAYRTHSGEMWAGSVDPEHERPDWEFLEDHEVG